MTRLEGKKPNTGAIIVAAIAFSLVAAGLFFAFWPVPEPTDAGLNNSAPAIEESAPETSAGATTPNGSEDSATAILTPLPEATPTTTPTPTITPTTTASAGGPTNIGPPAAPPTAPMSSVKSAPTAQSR